MMPMCSGTSQSCLFTNPSELKPERSRQNHSYHLRWEHPFLSHCSSKWEGLPSNRAVAMIKDPKSNLQKKGSITSHSSVQTTTQRRQSLRTRSSQSPGIHHHEQRVMNTCYCSELFSIQFRIPAKE